MFNSIIFDKSSFESFNIDEIFFLRQYYFPIITPILIIEILADLKNTNNSKETEKRVQQLSYKILQLNPKYIINYDELIERELTGEFIEMGRRPIVGQGKNVISTEGKKGVVISQFFEEAMLHRWRKREFNDAEELSAEQWRKLMNKITIDLSDLEMSQDIRKIKNLPDIINYVNQYLSNPGSQRNILETLLKVYLIDSKVASEVFYKYETKQFSLLKDFAPYSYFCIRIFMVFTISILRGIITPRKTDIIDLQYLYFLPFTTIFSSNDKFHRMFTSLFIEKDQKYFQGFDLKEDLKKIIEIRDSYNGKKRDQWVIEHRNYPPHIEESLTFNLWRKNVQKPISADSHNGLKKSPEEEKEIVDRINRLKNSQEDPGVQKPFKDEDTDFILIERKISPNDFCPCNSGKLFKNCHLPKGAKKQP